MKNKWKKISVVAIVLLLLSVGVSALCINRTQVAKKSVNYTENYTEDYVANYTENNASIIQESLEYGIITEENITEENSQYDSLNNGNIILMEYIGNADSVVVPSELDNRKVEQVYSEAFINNSYLEMIKIPIEIADNIEEIEGFEFSETLSDDTYVIYITTKEYTEEYLRYIRLTDEEKAKYEAIPGKFMIYLDEVKLQEPMANANEIENANANTCASSIPSSYDLRNNITIPVEDQGALGICYAYAATTSTETYIALNYGVTRDFSEIHLAVKSGLLYGGWFPDLEYYYPGYGPVIEKANTLLNQSYLTSQRNNGNIVASNIYNACLSEPSTVTEEQIVEATDALDAVVSEPEYYVMKRISFASIYGNQKKDSSYDTIVEENRNAIKEHIMKNGSVYTGISGPSTNNYIDYGSTAVMCQTTEGRASHAVSIIGWDDNFSASNFPSEWGVTQNGAWLALNSWGSTWGNGDGTFWISYEDYYVEAYNNGVVDVSKGKVNVNNVDISLETTSYIYDGYSKTPMVLFKYDDVAWSKGTNYTVSYSNNTNAGTATATITGMGRFTGTKTLNFTITPKAISSCTATLGSSTYTYDGLAKTPTVTVTDGSTTLTANTDYTVSYSNNTNAGTANVTITGKGNYKGSITKTFTITAKSISSYTATLSTSTYTYDGLAKTPTVTVQNGSTTLTANTDYTVSYSSNTNVGNATATITGRGNYTGSISKTFTITAKSISLCTATLDTSTCVYNGLAQTPTVTIQDGSTTLTANTDYTVSYSSNTNVGNATVTITGRGNYTGSISKTFTITAKSISLCIATLDTSTYTYDGTAKTPTVTVEDGNTTLTLDEDYTVSYSSNTNAGDATVTITGIGNYTGSMQKTFTIIGKDISSYTATLDISTYTYDGTAKTPTVTVEDGNTTLTLDTDYTVSYSSNTNAGDAFVIVTGIGNYAGSISKTFTITAKDISSSTATLDTSTYTYDGLAKTPTVTVEDGNTTLTLDEDYTVSYSSNTNVGNATVTITGIGNYSGTTTKNFVINKGTMEATADSYEVTYDGKEHMAQINIATKNANEIIKYGNTEDECDLDTCPVYKNVGIYKIYYVIQASNYNDVTGSVTIKINAKNINTVTLDLDANSYSYNGSAILPAITIKDGDTVLEEDQDYKVEYSNNINAGTGSVKVFGIGNYNGNNSDTFTITKGTPTYTIPYGIVTSEGSKLKDITLPIGFSWEENLETDVGAVGENTFKCTYTPQDTANYNIVTGIEVTIKVTEKLKVDIEEYITTLAKDESTLYITGITADTSLTQIIENIKTNGTMRTYQRDGAEISKNNQITKTGMKLKVQTEAEEIDYIFIVSGDNNGDGKFNSVDLLKLARYLAELDTDLSGEFLYASNVHQDELVNEVDLLKMARVISGLDTISN